MRKIRLIVFLLLACVWLCMGCSSEDLQMEAPNKTGVLCLHMSSDEAYVQSETRATHPLTDFSGYAFTLNGQPITFTDGKAIVTEGAYTLSATNSASVDGGYAGPLYSGITSFSLVAGEYKTVELGLGAPKNAKVVLALTDSLMKYYSLQTLRLNDGKREHMLESEADECFFPVTSTTINYTLVAYAKAGSGVQDITDATGSINISSGVQTTLILDVNPITGYITIVKGDPYGGEFQ